MRLLIANGYLIDPSQGLNAEKNLLIEDGRVAGLLDRGEDVPEGAQVLDATGLVVAPGFIDMHVHLREPGQEYKETIASGASAAVAGGFTSVCAMPNTDPVNDNPAVTRFIIEEAEGAGLANVFPVGAITKNSKGTELSEMGEMKRAGVVAVTDDGRPVPSAGMMRRAMEYATGFDLAVVDHCEDRSLAAGGAMHEGRWSLILGLRGMPAAAEEMDAVRDCALAELTGARVHLAHVSTKGAIEAVRAAKEKGLTVTCEVAPHHWALTDRAVEGYDTNMKMNPPLRSHDHVEAVMEGLRSGTVDAIATDHAPHHADEKALEFDRAPFGIIGLETAVGLALDRLVHEGVISLERLVELLSVNPAKIFKLEGRGTLRRGSWGDVTILDPELRWTFDVSSSKSRSRNTPFDGWTMRGAAVATIVSGRVLFKHPEFDKRIIEQQSEVGIK
ncbi:MAG: dihydroorotase [Acidobacteria bacterium 13_1_20CM_3_53_8]|nr:MAG: dihydroorotase [Acidobacteria bacterium 13_1_20CM_3_53_8]